MWPHFLWCFQTTIHAIFPSHGFWWKKKKKFLPEMWLRGNQGKCHPRPWGISQPWVTSPVPRTWVLVNAESFKTSPGDTAFLSPPGDNPKPIGCRNFLVICSHCCPWPWQVKAQAGFPAQKATMAAAMNFNSCRKCPAALPLQPRQLPLPIRGQGNTTAATVGSGPELLRLSTPAGSRAWHVQAREGHGQRVQRPHSWS